MGASDTRMRSILKQVTLLNCILLAGIAAFAFFVLVPILTVEVKVPLPAGTPPAKTAAPKEASGPAAIPSPQDYSVVTEKNLFHPERTLTAAKKEEATVPKPDFVLYGTLISENVRIAYMSDRKAPRTSPGRGKRQTALKTGESMSGYTLKEVLPDRVIMVRGDDRIEVRVIAPGGKKERGNGTAQPGVPSPVTPAIPGVIPAPQPQPVQPPVQPPRPTNIPRPVPRPSPVLPQR